MTIGPSASLASDSVRNGHVKTAMNGEPRDDADQVAFPAWEELPTLKEGPPYNAWGLYGADDELGRLNLITPSVVRRGLASAEYGIVINLNLPLNRQTSYGARCGLTQHIVAPIPPNGQALDDELSFNTQCGTQWDGFRHFPYKNWPRRGDLTFYNGQSLQSAMDPAESRNGIQNYAIHPITSRAHLLDLPRYLAKNNLSPLVQLDNTTRITTALLDACCAYEGIHFLPGDILVLNIGHLDAVLALGDAEKEREVVRYCGVEKSLEMARWHWERGIAAVVTDGVSYETSKEPDNPIYLHELFLAGWGMPIGEWFDLRQLCAECERLNKYSFLFTSMPLNVVGGIASPPNAQAIL